MNTITKYRNILFALPTSYRRVEGLLWWSTLIFATVLSQTVAAADMAPFSPKPLFLENERTRLSSAPMVLRLHEDNLFVLSSTDTSRGQVSALNADTLEIRSTRNLPVIPLDMVVDINGTVFVLGENASGNSELLAMNSSFQALDTFDTGEALTFPILSLPGIDTLVIGSMRHPMVVIDTQSRENLRQSATFKPPAFSTGVGLTWTSADWKTLFVNSSVEVSLVAYDIASTRRLSNIGYTLKSGEVEPYQTVGVTGGHPCNSTTGTSFLIWDSQRESLTLAEFDPVFRSLDIQTTVDTPLGAGNPDWSDLISGTGTLKPSGLLASNCEQSAILLGSKRSNRVVQYSINKEYRSIEVTGIINTTFAPVSVVMDPQGRFAFLASDEKQLIVRYEPEIVDAQNIVSGDPAIRNLQRLLTDNGYPVGSIDGIIGPKTQKALELYQQKTGTTLDLDNLEMVLEQSRAILR